MFTIQIWLIPKRFKTSARLIPHDILSILKSFFDPSALFSPRKKFLEAK